MPTAHANGSLKKGERATLTAVAQYPSGVTETQIAILTGYKATSRGEFLKRLKAQAFIARSGDKIVATELGLAELGEFEKLPTGRDLLEHWRRTLSGGEKTLLDAVFLAPEHTSDAASLQSFTGYKATSIQEFTKKLLARQILVRLRPGVVCISQELL